MSTESVWPDGHMLPASPALDALIAETLGTPFTLDNQMSEKIELQRVRYDRTPENDRGDIRAYRAFAVGPDGREFFATFQATSTLERDPVAFDQVMRANLRSMYAYPD